MGRERFARGVLVCVSFITGVGCSSRATDQTQATTTIAAPITEQPDAHCSLKSYQGHDYWFCSDHRSWQAAEQRCSAVGTHLTRVDASGENTFLDANSQTRIWIGAHEPARNGSWSWTEGDSPFWQNGQAIGTSYVNWEPGAPRGGQTCAQMEQPGDWDSADCNAQMAYVCESDASTVSFPMAPDVGCTRHLHAGHEYWTCNAQSSRDAARGKCQGIGMDLVTIDDAAEDQFLAGVVEQPSLIGLSDDAVANDWTWVGDNRSVWCGDAAGRKWMSTSYVNWASHQPFAGPPACTHKSHSGHDYWVCSRTLDWNGAEHACGSIGFSLASVNSADENAFLAGIANDAWLDGRTDDGHRNWWWSSSHLEFWHGDDTGSGFGRFASWDRSQPTRETDHDCTILNASGKWQSKSCASGHNFVCEGHDGGAGAPPSTRTCAVISTNGDWSTVPCEQPSAYVCESVAPNAGKSLDQLSDLVRDEYRSGKPRVSYVRFDEAASLTDPFSAYGDRYGLRACVDTLDPRAASRTVVSSGLEQQFYDQVYDGVPVFGRGYSALRDPTSKDVRSLTGHFEPNLTLSVAPAINESVAFIKAIAALGIKSAKNQPTGRLVVFPARGGPHPDWRLAWLFEFPATATSPSQAVAISATNGQAFHLGTSVRAATRAAPCAGTSSVNVQAVTLASTQLQVDAYQQDLFQDPGTADASHVTSGLTATPYVLYSQGLSGSPTTSPKIYAQCDGDIFPNITALQSASVSVAKDSPENAVAAGVFLGTQQCLTYLASTFQVSGGQPWLGFDGTGTQDVLLQMHRPGAGEPASPNYNPPGTSTPAMIRIDPDDNGPALRLGSSPEILCHEVGHGIWRTNVSGDTAESIETQAVEEAFGDVIGTGAEAFVRGYQEESAWCFDGDTDKNLTCNRDFKLPLASAQDLVLGCEDGSTPSGGICASGDPEVPHAVFGACSVDQTITHCPDQFRGPDYCPYESCDADPKPVPCCDRHHNATILDHWVYAVSKGANAANAASCPYSLDPIDPDPATALKKATQIVFAATQSGNLTAASGFEDMANATQTAATTLFPNDPELEGKLSSAWFGSSVLTESLPDVQVPLISPARNASKINPWVRFDWPIACTHPATCTPDQRATTYDFQLATGPFDASANIIYESKTPIADVFDADQTDATDGPEVGILRLALSFDTTTRYFWRTRPHSTDAWLDCYPINSFVGTGEPPDVDSITFENALSDHTVYPGAVFPRWPAVDGAVTYNVFVSAPAALTDQPVDPNCQGTPVTTTNDIGSLELTGIQPQQKYILNVQPVGPNDVNGKGPRKSESIDFRKAVGRLGIDRIELT